MAEGYKDFVPGDPLTAAQVEEYLLLQSFMRFASAAARDSALAAVLTEGLLAFLEDTNTLTLYTGAAWSTVGPLHGALTSWTPVVVQSNTPTLTNTRSTYQRTGRLVTVFFDVTITSAGTASSTITMTVPGGASAQGVNPFVGQALFYDLSTTNAYPVTVEFTTTTAVRFVGAAVNTLFADIILGSGSSTFNGALANGDILSGQFTYEAAADA